MVEFFSRDPNTLSPWILFVALSPLWLAVIHTLFFERGKKSGGFIAVSVGTVKSKIHILDLRITKVLGEFAEKHQDVIETLDEGARNPLSAWSVIAGILIILLCMSVIVAGSSLYWDFETNPVYRVCGWITMKASGVFVLSWIVHALHAQCWPRIRKRIPQARVLGTQT